MANNYLDLELIRYLDSHFDKLEKKIDDNNKSLNAKIENSHKALNDKIDRLEEKYFKFIARWTFIFGLTIIGLLVKLAFFEKKTSLLLTKTIKIG